MSAGGGYYFVIDTYSNRTIFSAKNVRTSSSMSRRTECRLTGGGFFFGFWFERGRREE